jgi:glycosyltransferase involved in cell wall biosynthesis
MNPEQAKLRIAYLVSHPIQYQAPLFRLLAKRPDVEFKAFFLHSTSTKEHFDKGFGQAIAWDVPLLEGYDHETLPSAGPHGKYRDFMHTGLAERLREGRFDVLWVHGWAHVTNLRAMGLAKRLGIKVLIRGESNLLGEPTQGIRPFAKKRFLNWLFRRVDGYLYIGSLNREFYRHYGVPEDRLFPVPYSVDNAFFRQRVEQARGGREALRASLGLAPGRPVILFTGKLLPHKGPMDLLRAYIGLSPDGRAEPLPYLLFAGSGMERESLEQKVRETGWSSVKFLGFQNQTELPRIFDLCDLFVMPSHAEPWGLVVNEVMNAGKPVIASTAVGCARDLIAEGENGWSFPAGDVNELQRVLRMAFARPEMLPAMGQRSLERISRWGFAEDIEGLLLAANTLARAKALGKAPSSRDMELESAGTR